MRVLGREDEDGVVGDEDDGDDVADSDDDDADGGGRELGSRSVSVGMLGHALIGSAAARAVIAAAAENLCGITPGGS